MINEKKVEQVRKFVWDVYTELRSMRGKRKKIDIFAVEMTMMQLGCLANGMQRKRKKVSRRPGLPMAKIYLGHARWLEDQGPSYKQQAASCKRQAASLNLSHFRMIPISKFNLRLKVSKNKP
jgi:hypothetical protein